jgi:hypothetical protein
MPIREGAAENQFYSDKTFWPFMLMEYRRNVGFWKTVAIISVTNNNFTIANKFADTFEVEYKSYLGAKRSKSGSQFSI